MGNGKKVYQAVLFSIVFLFTFGTSLVWADDGIEVLRQTSKAFTQVAKKAIPAVVSIKVEKSIERGSGFGNSPFGDDFFDRFFGPMRPRQQAPRKQKQVGQGSGFVISPDGYIMTNNHVVGSAEKITVTFSSGKEYKAELIGTDPDSDVAVIKIDVKDQPVIELADSDALEIGEWVIAVGNPFGLDATVTVGVVSAKGRSGVGITNYEDFIQTDAAINPGNSGGPLLNLDGKAVGINTAIFSQSGGYMGIGFAIPINMAEAIKDQLIESGKVARGYLGVEMSPKEMTPELAKLFGLEEENGVIITKVLEDSPAEKAGLKADDVIVKLNGKEVDNYLTFRNSIAFIAPGTEIVLTIYRNGKEKEMEVEIGSQAESVLGIANKWGLQVQNLTKDTAKQFGYEVDDGVIVSKVTDDGAADSAGVRPGMLILNINRKRIGSVDEFNDTMKKLGEAKKVYMLVRHDSYAEYVLLKLE